MEIPQVIDAGKELEKLLATFDTRIAAAIRASDEAHGKEREQLQAEVAELKAKQSAAEKAKATSDGWKVKGLEVVDPKNPAHFRKGVERASFFRYVKTLAADGINGKYGLDLSDCGLELELRTHMQEVSVTRASQNVGASSAGGALVPIEMQNELIPELLAASVAAKSGVTVVTGLVGNMSWPKHLTGVAGGYLDTEAEASISEETLTFGTVTASPHPLGAAVGITWLGMRQPAISMEATVRGDLVTKLALLKDKSIFKGSGQSGQPRGIVNWPNIGGVNWGTGITYGGASDTSQDKLREHYNDLENANALGDERGLSWVAQPAARQKLARVKDADGRTLYIAVGEPTVRNLLGYPVYTSTQLNNAAVTDAFLLFGKFSECIDANWGSIELDITNSHSSDFLKGRVLVRAIMQHDVAVRYPEAFSLASSLNAS